MPAYVEIGPEPVPAEATAVTVPTRDGVELAADHYPASGHRQAPTVLVRLPYDKDGVYCFMPAIAARFTAAGYHVLVQDVRGKFRSGGTTQMFVHEVADGHDTIDWIVDQPWSDGVVVMWGDSYYGYTQWAAVASGHGALRAISPRVTGTRLADVIADAGGDSTVELTAHRAYAAQHFVGATTYEWTPDWSLRPLEAQFEELFEQLGTRSADYDRLRDGGPAVDRFPDGHPREAPPVEVLHTVGWYDNCAPYSWADQAWLSTDPRWRDRVTLRIEAIDHENNLLGGDGAVQVAVQPDGGPAATLLDRCTGPAIEFFDAVLRGSGPRPPAVSYELVHAGPRVASSWPPAGGRDVVLHLAPPATGDGDGCLVEQAPDGATVGWHHEPARPVPSFADDPFAYLEGWADQRPLSRRPDVAAFTGPARTGDLDLVGPIRLEGVLSSTCSSTDVFVRVLDLDPAGQAWPIARGQVHLPDAGPGRALRVDLGHVGYRIRAGHALLVHVHSSDHPEFVPDPGDGSDPWLARDAAAADHTLHLGGAAGTRLHLTVAPPEARS